MLRNIFIKRRLHKEGFEILPITKDALRLYKTIVKDNAEESDFLAKCKLSRNWHCSTKEKILGDITWRYYGNLAIGVKDGVIVKIHNKEGYYGLHINRDIKNRINSIIKSIERKKVA